MMPRWVLQCTAAVLLPLVAVDSSLPTSLDLLVDRHTPIFTSAQESFLTEAISGALTCDFAKLLASPLISIGTLWGKTRHAQRRYREPKGHKSFWGAVVNGVGITAFFVSLGYFATSDATWR